MELKIMQNGSKKINLAFFLEKFGSWEGETNYLKSLISAVDQFKEKNVEILIFTSTKVSKDLKNLNLKNSKIINSKFFDESYHLNIFRKIVSRVFKSKDPIILYFVLKYKIDIITHYKPFSFCKTICWMPDFQHLLLPNNFTSNEIKRRNLLYNHIVNNASLVLLSSNDSINHLKRFTKKKIKYKKLNFVPNINFDLLNIDYKINRFNLKKFFIVPNQFWKHKNHIILVKALENIRDKKIDFKIVITGEKKSQLNDNIFQEFIKEINKKKLKKYFLYLGKINYKDLINLIYLSHALINPSFFEGWSTTVEEAKALGKYVLLSNLKVHREQNPPKSIYFNPTNSKQLSNCILKLSSKKKKLSTINYLKKTNYLNRAKFAENYFKILRFTYKL